MAGSALTPPILLTIALAASIVLSLATSARRLIGGIFQGGDQAVFTGIAGSIVVLLASWIAVESLLGFVVRSS
jgi:hypothetical protein